MVKDNQMIPQNLQQDLERFYQAIVDNPGETVTLTLTGRKGDYVGRSIKYDRYIAKKPRAAEKG